MNRVAQLKGWVEERSDDIQLRPASFIDGYRVAQLRGLTQPTSAFDQFRSLLRDHEQVLRRNATCPMKP